MYLSYVIDYTSYQLLGQYLCKKDASVQRNGKHTNVRKTNNMSSPKTTSTKCIYVVINVY